MSKFMKGVIVALAAILALAIFLAWLGPRLLGDNVRSRLEADATDALGMQVQVAQRPALRFFPGMHVTVRDVRIHNGAVDVASIGEVKLGIDLRSLLHKDMKFEDLRIKDARIVIEGDKSGHFNIDTPNKPKSNSAGADIAKVSFAESSLSYTDARFGTDFAAENCSVELRDFAVAPAAPQGLMKGISFKGELVCAHVRNKNLTATKVKASVAAANDAVKFEPITLEILGGHGAGVITGDFKAAQAVYRVHSSIEKLQIADFSKTVAGAKIAEGTLQFSADLTMRNTPNSSLMRTADGEASLHGNNLRLAIGDLDKKLERYESTQNFNLIDVGAFFLAGPLGVAITKGYDYARILQKDQGQTTIRTLVSQWKIERGVAAAEDVALATPKNRLAMQGGLDLVKDTYEEVTVALLSPEGCARVEQKIRGSFGNPDVEKPNVITAVTGPARKILYKGKKLLGAKCTVFYSGAVQSPK